MKARTASLWISIAALAVGGLALAPGASAAVQPYGDQRRGRLPQRAPAWRGRRRQRRAARSSSRPPATARTTSTDQQPLYTDLLYASPNITDADVADYFKDATFGVQSDEVESRARRAPA